jgi:hypothetical protein
MGVPVECDFENHTGQCTSRARESVRHRDCVAFKLEDQILHFLSHNYEKTPTSMRVNVKIVYVEDQLPAASPLTSDACLGSFRIQRAVDNDLAEVERGGGHAWLCDRGV